MDQVSGIDSRRLYRYVSGCCSESDRQLVEAWIAQDAARRVMIDEMRRVWQATNGSIQRRDVDAAWQRMQRRRLTDERSARRAAPSRPPRVRNRGVRSFFTFPTRVAAVLLLVAATLVLGDWSGVLTWTRPEEPTPQPHVYQTLKGQRAVITLTDGSVIHLNVGSMLTVPVDFGLTSRTVNLDGEAFFDVTRETDLPFRINTNQMDVQVLGTSFNVRAYSHDDATNVAVVEGKVAVHPAAASPADTLTLLSRDVAFLVRSRLQSVDRQVDLSRYLAWTEGRLVFHRASFEQVARSLEQWYDLDIDTSVPLHRISTFNGTFQDESLSEILKTVAATLGLSYTRDRRHITFYANPAAEAEVAHEEQRSPKHSGRR